MIKKYHITQYGVLYETLTLIILPGVLIFSNIDIFPKIVIAIIFCVSALYLRVIIVNLYNFLFLKKAVLEIHPDKVVFRDLFMSFGVKTISWKDVNKVDTDGDKVIFTLKGKWNSIVQGENILNRRFSSVDNQTMFFMNWVSSKEQIIESIHTTFAEYEGIQDIKRVYL